MQTNRFKHKSKMDTPPYSIDSRCLIRPTLVAGLPTSLVWESLILNSHWTLSTIMHLFTVTSGNNGCGFYWSGHWLQAHWFPMQQSMDVTWKELYTIVFAVHI